MVGRAGGAPVSDKDKQMSRIGNKPIAVPQGVKIALEGGKVEVQGPKGKLSVAVPRGITFEHKDGTLVAKRSTEEHRSEERRVGKECRSRWSVEQEEKTDGSAQR